MTPFDLESQSQTTKSGGLFLRSVTGSRDGSESEDADVRALQPFSLKPFIEDQAPGYDFHRDPWRCATIFIGTLGAVGREV